MKKGKIIRENLNARKNYWRSQIDFRKGFFDNPETETKENVKAFENFFRKYDSYTDIRNIISERNRFDFVDDENEETYIQIWSEMKCLLLPKQRREIERKINDLVDKMDQKKFSILIKEKLGPLVRIYYPRVYYSINEKGDPQIRISNFPFKVWKFNNKKPYQWIWEKATYKTTTNPYDYEEGMWSSEPSIEDVYKSFGVDDPEIIKNMSSRESATKALSEIIFASLGGKDVLLNIIREVLIPNQLEEFKKWEEEERKETEARTHDDDNFGYSSHKRIRFS